MRSESHAPGGPQLKCSNVKAECRGRAWGQTNVVKRPRYPIGFGIVELAVYRRFVEEEFRAFWTAELRRGISCVFIVRTADTTGCCRLLAGACLVSIVFCSLVKTKVR